MAKVIAIAVGALKLPALYDLVTTERVFELRGALPQAFSGGMSP